MGGARFGPALDRETDLRMTMLPNKDVEEVIPVQFDFTDEIGSATIQTKTVAVNVKSGNDDAPANILQGVMTESSGIVEQTVKAGRAGVTYHLRCTATLSDGRVLVIPADLPVIRA